MQILRDLTSIRVHYKTVVININILDCLNIQNWTICTTSSVTTILSIMST